MLPGSERISDCVETYNGTMEKYFAAKQEIKHSVMQSSSQINTSGINIKTNSNLNLKGMNAILNAQAQAKVSGATVMAKGSGSTMLG